MPAYSGSSFPYWMTIQDNGSTANAGAVSENVPVTVGTSYTFTVNVAYSGFFSTGVKLTLSWYEANSTLISSVTATSGAMSPDEIFTVATAATAAPANAAYATAVVAMNGLPGEANILSVYSAAVTPAGAVPVNVNYAYTWTFWPWTAVNGATLGWQADQFLLDNSDSLVLGNVIELMGGAGGVPNAAIPELLDANGTGPRFRILAPPSLNSMAYGYETSYDLNAPQPQQDVIASMLLDGERPFGTRASNRTITLPVIIFGTLAGGMRQVLAAREYLMSVIDQQVWQIVWTPADTGKPLVYDCFRALPSVPMYGFNYSAGGSATDATVGRPNYPIALITIQVQALPYGRSDIDGVQSLAFTNPLINSPVPPGSLSLDNFSSVTAGEGWVQDETRFVQGGTASIRYDAPVPLASPYPAAVYSRTLAAAVSLAGLPAVSVWLGQAYDTQWPAAPGFVSNVTLAWTLTDGAGRTLSFSATSNAAAWGALPSTPKWTLVTAPIPQGRANFNYGDVTAYSVRITNWAGSGNTGLVRMHAWLNDLVANPQTVANAASPRGMLYNLFSLPGSARAPINVQCQLPATAPVTQEITTPLSGSWIVPPSVYSVEAEAWGGGGAGATVNLARPVAGAGGGGGEYAAESLLPVVPGTAVPYSLGSGGTPSQQVDTVIDLITPGLHSWLCPANVTSLQVECWGGGAAGAAGSGGGGAGSYASVAIPVVPGTSYLLNVGAGGLANTGTTAADQAARNGAASWFGTQAATGPSNAIVSAAGGLSPTTGSGNGGTGGAAASGLGVADGTFESGVSQWTPTNGTVARSSAQSFSGAYSAKFTVTGSPSQAYLRDNISNMVSVCPGASYTATMEVFTATAGQTFNAAIDWFSEDFQYLSTSSGSGTVLTASTWTALSETATAPAGAAYAAYGPTVVTPAANLVFYADIVFLNYASGSSSQQGGNGGHAPGGGGGGGGGCGGRSGSGHHGRPPAANGFGAAWCGSGQGGDGDGSNSGSGYQHGGDGGDGASAPGTPSGGSYPGGGGGGGFCGSYFQFAAQPAQATTGQTQVNYMGANGANGLVQLTYAIGDGSPVNGGTTTFGSAATTGTTVTANGGTSAAANSATGAGGGSGSGNTVHAPGGPGGLDVTGPQASWMFGLQSGAALFQSLAQATWTTGTHTTGTAGSSCAQGGAIAVIESAAPVFDLAVTDSAGNTYVNQGQQGGGSGGTTGCVYVFTCPVANPITTSTTLTVTSATAQQYGVIWYASSWILDATGQNTGNGSGTGTALSGQFGTADTITAQYELVIAFNATNQTFNAPTYGGKLWYAPGSTSSLLAGSLAMQAYVGLNEGGGTGGANGDAFAQTIGGSAAWAVLCIPITAASQQAYAAQLDWRGGATPGASTTWNTCASISAEGMIAVVGMAGSGSGITAGPSAISDQGGNVYTIRNTTVLPSNGGVMFLATAPVTAALAQGASGTVSWGHASAAPEYWTSTYWIPNATGFDGVSAVTGGASAPSAVFAPSASNDMVFAVAGNAVSGAANSVTAAPWNYLGSNSQSYVNGQAWACQATDRTAVTAQGSVTETWWGMLAFGFAMNVRAAGGGAAGGPNGSGYPSTFYAGAPAYSGGGKGGLGAQSLNTNGGGAALPGGGGGGSYGATTTSIPGGQGGQGAVRVTYSPPLTPFNTLIVHRPGENANQNFNPLVPIPFSDVPNNTEYTVANVIQPAVNAVFNSTYTVLLVNHFWDSAALGTARTITVTVSQYEYRGGPASSVQVSRSVTPATDVVNGMVNMGEVTLPVKDYAKFNDQSYFTVSVNDTNQNDRFMDVLFLDTTGQTVLINIDPSQPGYNTYVNFYIDEPTPDRDLGFIGGTCQDRQHNVSLMEYAFISGGPLYIGAGDNLLLTYSPSGSPSLGLTYSPRWYLDRIV